MPNFKTGTLSLVADSQPLTENKITEQKRNYQFFFNKTIHIF